MRPIEELMTHLSDKVRDDLESGGYDANEISKAIEAHIQSLYDDLGELDVKYHKENGRITAMNDRMLRVLTAINDVVMPIYAPDKDLDQKDTGSDRGNWEYAEHCGVTWLANIVGDILLEKHNV